MAVSGIDVCSNALVRLGEEQIQSFNEDTEAAETCAQLYEPLVSFIYTLHPWNFAKQRVQLALAASNPINEWTYAYQMPTDGILDLLAVFDSSAVGATPYTHYELFGDTLQTNAATIFIEYRRKLTEDKWPPAFRHAVELAMAAALAMPITDQRNTAEYYHTLAYGNPSDNYRGGALGAAMREDSRGQPSASILDTGDPLTAVRS